MLNRKNLLAVALQLKNDRNFQSMWNFETNLRSSNLRQPASRRIQSNRRHIHANPKRRPQNSFVWYRGILKDLKLPSMKDGVSTLTSNLHHSVINRLLYLNVWPNKLLQLSHLIFGQHRSPNSFQSDWYFRSGEFSW